MTDRFSSAVSPKTALSAAQGTAQVDATATGSTLSRIAIQSASSKNRSKTRPVSPGMKPACLPRRGDLRRRQVKKVEHYYLSVDALTQPMQVRDPTSRYGE
jgi:hypothetical protein